MAIASRLTNKLHRADKMIDTEQAERFAHWQHLMQQVAENKDKDAFAEIFDYFAPRLKSFLLSSQVGDEQLANDLIQEVMIKVWNKAHLYNPDSAAVSTWIFTLARNTRIDYLRKHNPASSNIDPEPIFEILEDESASPFENLQQQKTEAKVRESINTLPFEQAQIVAKTYLEGKTHTEAANELNLPLGTVKSRLRIALVKLEVVLRSESRGESNE